LSGGLAIDNMEDRNLDGGKQWHNMLEYFNKNPSALMDAMPTPKKLEDVDALEGLNTCLTPKKKGSAQSLVLRPTE
jgi:hypothetical protein